MNDARLRSQARMTVLSEKELLAVLDDGRFEAESWETGRTAGVVHYSKQHIWDDKGIRMLCGVAPNWVIGNFGSSHSGRCKRCFPIAHKRMDTASP